MRFAAGAGRGGANASAIAGMWSGCVGAPAGMPKPGSSGLKSSGSATGLGPAPKPNSEAGAGWAGSPNGLAIGAAGANGENGSLPKPLTW